MHGNTTTLLNIILVKSGVIIVNYISMQTLALVGLSLLPQDKLSDFKTPQILLMGLFVVASIGFVNELFFIRKAYQTKKTS